MISVIYCNSDTPPKVVAAGDCMLPATHLHDGVRVNCEILNNIDEPNLISYPHMTRDGTLINDSHEWLEYLRKYLPQ